VVLVVGWGEEVILRTLVVTAALAVGCSKPADDATNQPSDPTAPTGWSEPEWCAQLGDLSAVEAAHTSAALRETLIGISDVRYPPAVGFIDAQSDSELSLWFFGGTDDFDDVLDGYEVAVHEGCHIWGFGQLDFSTYSYRIVDDDLVLETAWLDNFARSEILSRHPYPNADFYADTYLTGDSGAQGFNTVLDEFNAYTHSLASRYCTRDTIAGATSAKDGLLTFMLYVELYLELAEEEHPDDYAAIVGDPGHVEVILAIWDRAEHWLAKAADHPELGIDDAFISEYVYDPARLARIEALR
jgi:hypothetical protein